MSVNGGDYNSLGQLFTKIPSVHTESKCTSTCCGSDSNLEEIVYYPLQSALQQSNTDSTSTTDATNVSFNDEAPGESVDIPADIHTESPYVPSNVHISKFLNRPVLIKNYTWSLGSTTVAEFDPWNLYFSHTSIKKKIDNYYLMRCKLKLKFVINASPFHYGCMLAAYKPLSKYLTSAPIDTSSTGSTEDFQNVGFSQLPRVYIYPQTSQGGEMNLPFLWPKEWLDATYSSELTNMGTVYLRPLTALAFANAGVGVNCNIQVFAWAEDVELSGPTVRLAMQSGEDEYGSISGPASAVANVAGMLEKAPVIGIYATATRMAATAVGSIAKMFGFTNVPVIADIHQFTPSPFPMFASPEIGTQIEKLTLDPKNELTIDPRSVGVDTGDELLINHVTDREAYLTQFTWTLAGAPDDILFSAQVSPFFERTAVGTNQTLIQMTPMSLVARMFSFWRGDIKIRLKFICSQYHKGRLRISWDPVGAIGATADSTTEVFTQIVDLADCTDITFNIPYMQTTAFLNCIYTYGQRFANDGSITNSYGATNGVFTARILNELSAPLNTADIKVLVFVAGGDNLEFAAPSEIDHYYATTPICATPAQSGFQKYDTEESSVEMGEAPSNPPLTTYLTYHGEVVKSLRMLMRRTGLQYFMPLNSTSLTSTANGFMAFNRLSRYPYYPGSDTNGLFDCTKLAGGAGRINYVKWHPLTWVSQCFLGCRGAINYRFNLNSKLDVASFSAIRTILDTSVALGTSTYRTARVTDATHTTAYYKPAFYDMSGLSLTNTKTNTGLNVSFPYYSKFKFRTTSSLYSTIGSATDDTNLDWIQVNTLLNPAADSNATSTYNNIGFEAYVGAGTDYNPIFFVNVPTLYVYTSLPLAA